MAKKRRVVTAAAVMRELSRLREELAITRQNVAEINGALGIILSLVRKKVDVDTRGPDPKAIEAALKGEGDG